MQIKVTKTGNSLYAIIPSYMAKILEIKKGTKLDINLQGKKIIIQKDDEND